MHEYTIGVAIVPLYLGKVINPSQGNDSNVSYHVSTRLQQGLRAEPVDGRCLKLVGTPKERRLRVDLKYEAVGKVTGATVTLIIPILVVEP